MRARLADTWYGGGGGPSAGNRLAKGPEKETESRCRSPNPKPASSQTDGARRRAPRPSPEAVGSFPETVATVLSPPFCNTQCFQTAASVESWLLSTQNATTRDYSCGKASGDRALLLHRAVTQTAAPQGRLLSVPGSLSAVPSPAPPALGRDPTFLALPTPYDSVGPAIQLRAGGRNWMEK